MFELLLFGLATWRVSIFLIEDDGPFRSAARLRQLVGAERPGELSGLAFVFTCIYCMSVWVAIVLWLIFVHNFSRDGYAIPTIAAWSAIAILAQHLQK